MKLTCRLIFNPNKRLRQDGTAQIVLYIGINARKKRIDTGFTCTPAQWNSKKQEIRGGAMENIALRAITSRVNEKYSLSIAAGKIPTIEELAAAAMGGPQKQTFLEFMDEQIEADNAISPATKANYRVALLWVTKYKPRLQFEELTPNYIDGLSHWLLRQKKKTGDPINPNYAKKVLDNLRKYVRVAIRYGHIQNNPFTGKSITKQATPHIWLTMQEVETLSKMELSGTEQLVRDAYVFACYTGTRFSDVFNLKSGNLEDRKSGLWLVYRPQKTARHGTKVELPLYSIFWNRPAKIAKSYAAGKLPQAPLFPSNIGNSYANKIIRRLATRARIKKRLTFHTSRHTCAMNLLLSGFSLEDVSKVLGHSDIATTQIYAKMLPERVARVSEEVFKKAK